MRPNAAAILEKAFRSTVVAEDGEPSAPDAAMVRKILDDPKMPAVAEPGMAYVVHWADGRGIFAMRKKASLKKWLTKTGEMAEIISIKYMKPEHKGKPLKVEAIQTPNIKIWFGKSKVVDDRGRPLKVYHGTHGHFNTFKISRGKELSGIFFSESRDEAVEWGKLKVDNPYVFDVFLRIEKPADYSDIRDMIEIGKTPDEVTRSLVKSGYDGYIDDRGGSREFVVFNPKQIRVINTPVTETAFIPGLLLEATFTAKDIDLDRTYGTFKASYEKQTGKAWDKAKFLDRIKDWTLYGDHDGFVAARQQASGPIKLVGAAGNPIGVKKGFQEVLAAGKPVWGAMDLRLATLAARMGLKMPPAWLMVRILTAIKDRFAQASGLDASAVQVNKDGSLTITYPDVGAATKFIVGNKMYFEWLLKTHGSALPAMLRTAISYFLTTGKPPPMPADQDEESFTLDDKPKVPPPPAPEVSDAPPQEAVQR